MDTIEYSDAGTRLAATMDRVIADHAPVVITRQGSPACVLVSFDDWESLEETAYLMSSSANAARLDEAIRALESGRGVVTRDSTDFLET